MKVCGGVHGKLSLLSGVPTLLERVTTGRALDGTLVLAVCAVETGKLSLRGTGKQYV